MDRGNKRITIRPGKSQAIFGGAVGALFVVLGLVVVIPIFGAFGIIWTLMAVGICGMNLYSAFGKGYKGPEIRIETDGDPAFPQGVEGSAEERMKQLRALYDQRLITQEEYEQKRADILKEL